MGKVTPKQHEDILHSRNSVKQVTIREIASIMHLSPTTVQKYARIPQEVKCFRQRRASMFDPFCEEIEALLNAEMGKQSRSVKTAMRDFRAAHPELKFGKSAFYQFVRDRCDLTRQPKLASIPLQHDAAEAQIDFCEVRYYRKFGSRIRRVDGHQFTMYFPHSDVSFVQIFPAENQQCLFEGMRNIFEFIGFVPKSILFDNASTAVLTTGGKGKDAIPTPEYASFAAYYGFKYLFCNPASGREKGGVEHENGIKRQDYFSPVPQIDDEESFNRELLTRCMDDANVPHYRIPMTKAELFNADRESGLPLPKIPFDCRKTERRKTDHSAIIQLQNKRYSVSDKYPRRWVVVKYGALYVDIYDEYGTFICRHRRSYVDGSMTIDKTMYADALHLRPRARIKESENEFTNNFWMDVQQAVTSRRPAARADAFVEFCEQHDVPVVPVPSGNAALLYGVEPYKINKECYDQTIQSNGLVVQTAQTRRSLRGSRPEQKKQRTGLSH